MSFCDRKSEDLEWLVLALRSRPIAQGIEALGVLWAKRPSEAWRDLARRNHVECATGAGVERALGREALDADWRAQLDLNEARVEALVATLSAVVTRLDRAGIAHTVIEGGGVTLCASPSLRGYDSRDFDVLVPCERFQEALEIVQAEGFKPSDRRGRPTVRIECVRRAGDEHQWIEIGCEQFDRMWIPVHFEERAQAWLARRTPLPTRAPLYVFDPSDAMVSVAVHTSMHTFIHPPGLRLYTDIERLAAAFPIDWQHVVDEARGMRAATRVLMALQLAQELFALPIPPFVFEQLCVDAERARSIATRIGGEGLLASGRGKLRGLTRVAVDRALDDRGNRAWLSDLLIPSTSWMRRHFDRSGEGASIFSLHTRRLQEGVRAWWRP